MIQSKQPLTGGTNSEYACQAASAGKDDKVNDPHRCRKTRIIMNPSRNILQSGDSIQVQSEEQESKKVTSRCVVENKTHYLLALKESKLNDLKNKKEELVCQLNNLKRKKMEKELLKLRDLKRKKEKELQLRDQVLKRESGAVASDEMPQDNKNNKCDKSKTPRMLQSRFKCLFP